MSDPTDKTTEKLIDILTNNTFPQTLMEYKRSYLLGIFSISVLVEDRRPDLSSAIGKYKHQISVKFLWKKFFIILRTTNRSGFYMMDGVDRSNDLD